MHVLSLKEAIALINQFDAKKFTVLLARIINRLPEKVTLITRVFFQL
jgi:hypothetical protein